MHPGQVDTRTNMLLLQKNLSFLCISLTVSLDHVKMRLIHFNSISNGHAQHPPIGQLGNLLPILRMHATCNIPFNKQSTNRMRLDLPDELCLQNSVNAPPLTTLFGGNLLISSLHCHQS